MFHLQKSQPQPKIPLHECLAYGGMPDSFEFDLDLPLDLHFLDLDHLDLGLRFLDLHFLDLLEIHLETD